MPSRPELSSTEAETLARILGPETVGRICQPTGTGTGLPNAAFTDPDFLALENKLLFPRTWTLAGYCHELAEPGDAVPVEVAGVPLILLRTRKTGDIADFQNVCRHRGTQLLSKPCKGAAALACPYHGWTYSLEGKLLKRPLFEGRDGHGAETDLHLFAVRTALWHDLIFVNLDGRAPAFEDYIAPLEKRSAGYNLGSLRHAGTLTWEINANWKFIHENFADSYHVPWCHPSLEEWKPAITHIASTDGPVLINGNSIPEKKQGERSGGLPPFPGMSDTAAGRAAFFTCSRVSTSTSILSRPRCSNSRRLAPTAPSSGSISILRPRRSSPALMPHAPRCSRSGRHSTQRISASSRLSRKAARPRRSMAACSRPTGTAPRATISQS